MGNCTNEASRSRPPRGRKNVATIIARAVNTPRTNLFQFMRFVPLAVPDFENRSDCTLLFAPPRMLPLFTPILWSPSSAPLSAISAVQAFAQSAAGNKIGAGSFPAPQVACNLARCVQARNRSLVLAAGNCYLLSATDGLVPKSRRLLAAVRAALALTWFTAAAP